MSEWPFRYFVAECIDDVGAELQRPLDPRARERVVDDGEDAALARELGDLRDVDQPQRRIGRRLDPDQLRVGRTRGLSSALVLRRSTKLKSRFARAPAHALEQAERAAVQVVHRDDVAAGVDQLEQRAGRRHAGGEREAVRAAFEIGDAALPRAARRVVRARIVVALVHARARLRVGRGRVDRRHHRAGRRIRATARRGCSEWRSRVLSVAVMRSSWRHDSAGAGSSARPSA